MNHWTIILNPAAGRGRGAREEKAIRSALPDAEILLTRKSGDAETLAFEAVQRGQHVAAAGGDGTLGEVLNGVMRAQTDTTIAILPVGTGNDFARTLGILDLGLALETLKSGEARRIDVGVARSAQGERFWLNIAGAGFDAVVAHRINSGKFLRGTPAYIAAVLATLRTFRAARLELLCDDKTERFGALMCAVANAQSYGGGMRIAPDAKLDDGLFDVCTIADASSLEFVRAFPSVFRGEHLSHPKVALRRAHTVKIASEPAWPVLLDGELWGETPVEFNLRPQAVKFLFSTSADSTTMAKAMSPTA
ncbi:MAG TPA: diacylglycerol kinase family protein [Abditibacteriaceae bacterium]